MKSHYSHFIIEGSSLTVNKWQSQGQTEIPNPRSLLFILSCCDSRSLTSGNKEAQRQKCVKQLYSAQKSRQYLWHFIAQRQSGKESSGQKCEHGASWQEAPVFPVQWKLGLSRRQVLAGPCVALQRPLQQSFRMQPLCGAELAEKPKPKHIRVIHAPCLVHCVGISQGKTRDSPFHYFFSK